MKRSESPSSEGSGKLSEDEQEEVTWIVRVIVDFSPGTTRPDVGEMVSQGGSRDDELGLRTKDHGASVYDECVSETRQVKR